ncbi:oxamate carbamoyltransferase subunit AllG family protein [Geodermatophilus sp. URMC 64]
MSTDVVLPDEVAVVNVGLPLFADAVRAQGRPAVQVDWRVPAGGDVEALRALRRLCGPLNERIDEANAEVFRRLDTGVPVLSAVRPAGEVVPGLTGRSLRHAGPALPFDQVGDPLRRSMRAAVVAEGWASSVGEADELLTSGSVGLGPANESGGVVPMAAVVGPSTPVWVVALDDVTAWAPLGQGAGDVPWFGRDTDGAVARLVLLREAVAPVLASAVAAAEEPVDVLSLAAQGVAMGDDVHVRTQAATNLLLKVLLPGLMAADHPRRVEVARFLSANHLLFLTLAMAAARALTEWACRVPGSSVVTTMARNGTTFGVRLPGSAWFLAPAPPVGRALFHPGRGPDDGAPDIGDSAVLELVGLGGAAAEGSPSVGSLVGGLEAAAALTRELDRVCVGRSSRILLPASGGRGTPVAVDVRRVVEHGITPKVTTGILHNSDGSGQIGAGVAEAPLGCFRAALLGLDRRLS